MQTKMILIITSILMLLGSCKEDIDYPLDIDYYYINETDKDILMCAVTSDSIFRYEIKSYGTLHLYEYQSKNEYQNPMNYKTDSLIINYGTVSKVYKYSDTMDNPLNRNYWKKVDLGKGKYEIKYFFKEVPK